MTPPDRVDVAILGCGYVGTELGRQLAERGEDVVGVRRSSEGVAAIEDRGFEGVRADLADAASLASVPDADALVFAASPDDRGAEAARRLHLDGLGTVLDAFGSRERPPDRLVYASSTGVYGDHGGDWVDEETEIDPPTEKTRVLARAEERVLSESPIEGAVARLAGLYGPDRYRLDRYLEGPVTEGYLNMVHRDDAAGAIRHLLAEDHARGERVVVVDDEPVEKWAFADWLAERCGVDPPPKRTVEERLADADLPESARRRIRANKRCSNRRLRSYGYRFAYPTYREGYRRAAEAFK